MSLEVTDEIDYGILNDFLAKNYIMNDLYKATISENTFLEKEAETLLNSESKYIFEHGKLTCVYTIEALPWDSHIFKMNMWKLRIISNPYSGHSSNILKENLLDECKEKRIDHLCCQVPSNDFRTIHLLEETGFKLVDNIIKFGTKLPANPPKNTTDFLIRPYNERDYSEVIKLASDAFSNYPNRYNNDPVISTEKGNQFYMEWVKNSIKGFANLMVVAQDNHSIAGFATVKYRELCDGVTIAGGQLAGVSPESRGQGINTIMLDERLNLVSQYAKIYEVGTQNYNFASQKTFYKCGLKPIDSYFSFHMDVKGLS